MTSFSEIALQAALEAAPELPRALLLDTLPDDWSARLQRLQCLALDAQHKLLDQGIVKAIHAAGFRVMTFVGSVSQRSPGCHAG